MNIDKDYKVVFEYIYDAAVNENEETLLKLMDMLQPLVKKYSRNSLTQKYDEEIHDALAVKLCEEIRNFKIR